MKNSRAKKLIIMVIAIMVVLSLFTILNTNKVYASDESNLNEIYEVYNNADDLPEGMVLSPNPTVGSENENLDEILKVYEDSDSENGDLSVLATGETTTTETTTTETEGSANPAVIIGIVVGCVVVVGVIVFLIIRSKK